MLTRGSPHRRAASTSAPSRERTEGDGHGRPRDADVHLDRSTSQTPHGAAVGAVIEAIAAAAIELAALIAAGPLAGITGRNGGINSDGDQQKDIDVVADGLIRDVRCARAPVAACRCPRKRRCRKSCDPEAPLCVAIDPLDGSANVDINISIGTIFSILPERRRRHRLDLLRARHRASSRPASSSTVRRPRSC